MNVGKLFLPVFVIIALGFNCSDDKRITSSPESFNNGVSKFTLDSLDSRALRLKPKYSYIRSYPSGGGVFVLRTSPEPYSPGHPSHNPVIEIQANPDLNAELITTFGGHVSNIIEATVSPSPDIEIGLHRFQIAVLYDEYSYRIALEVDVFQGEWSDDSLAIIKRDKFLPWLDSHYPEFEDLTELEWESYFTYPGIWVVEHWTFLSDKYELRVCWHVMIPPYDWSMLWLRERGRWNASLALKRESDGTIYTIPVTEYPEFYGY